MMRATARLIAKPEEFSPLLSIIVIELIKSFGQSPQFSDEVKSSDSSRQHQQLEKSRPSQTSRLTGTMRKRTSNGYVLYSRAVLVAVLGSALLAAELWQPALTFLWDTLRQWRVYRWSTFETLWTVFCYAAIEPSITVAFMKHPEWRIAHQKQTSEQPPPRPKGMRRPSRRGYEALTYIAPLMALDLLMIKKFADVPLEDMLVSGNYDPSMAAGRHRATFLMPSLHNFSLSSPLQTTRALPLEAPSSRRLAMELIVSFVLYDLLFFLFHLSMHILPILRTWHRPHHSHGEIHPQVTNQLHIVERLGLVLLANFSLNIIGSHVLTRTLFVPLFVWLLVEIHSGLDMPWGYEKILPSGWGGGARKHAQHHANGEAGFEPYFNWCDTAWNYCCRPSEAS